MRRRRLLQALPLAVGLSGCSDRSGESQPPAASTDSDSVTRAGTEVSSTATASPTADAGVTVGPRASVTLRAAYRYNYETDFIGVEAPENDQFAFVSPPPDTPRPPMDAFTLELDDRAFAPEPLEGRVLATMPRMPFGTEAVYFDHEPHGPSRTGALVFDVPTLDVDSAALVGEERRYPLPDESLDSFAVAPAFQVDSVSVPDSIAEGESLTAEVTVTNTGDRDGRFLAGVWQSGYPQNLTISVPAGETRSASVSYEQFHDRTLHFVHAGGETEYGIDVRTSPDPTATDSGG